jgi:hypothetical protein
MDSDRLVPLSLQGHDGFLMEGDQLAAIVAIVLHREGETSLDQL